jgi:hypothetical protein
MAWRGPDGAYGIVQAESELCGEFGLNFGLV